MPQALHECQAWLNIEQNGELMSDTGTIVLLDMNLQRINGMECLQR